MTTPKSIEKNERSQAEMTLGEMLDYFENPPAEYRGAPFWAWNGKLDQNELRRQIRIMKRMGMGGFFMHSRMGLETPYLSQEWMDCVNACIQEAEAQGMNAWLYDEDRWPSGFAGGFITKDETYRGHRILVEKINTLENISLDIKPLALYTAEINNNSVSGLARLKEFPDALEGHKTLLRFSFQADDCMPRYNGGGYLDTLNPEAVRKFIEVTHEAYRKKFSGYFGKTVPGIFTDEPRYNRLFSSERPGTLILPWTESLPEVFRRRYNYDILEHLPEIIFNVDSFSAKVRHNYIDCITYMFNHAFSRQIYQWCGENKLIFTGHILGEDTLGFQTFTVGSCMRFYEYMQAPGMDVLTEQWRVYDAAKQVSSIAHQFNRKWRLTETYGCTGWDFPFAGHKAMGDWQLALGINFRCHHLAWYTMQGQAKRDYPASISYQSAWWEKYKTVEDYFAGINLVMTRGEEIRDILFIHPVESAWVVFQEDYLTSEKLNKLNDNFVGLRNALLQQHLDFDYCDEDIMSRHAAVRNDGNVCLLQVAHAQYKAVVIPEMFTIRSSTLDLLEKFVDSGGLVIFAASPPRLVDAVESDRTIRFSRLCECFADHNMAVVNLLAQTCRRVSISPAGEKVQIEEALYLLREDESSAFLFIANTGCKDRQPKDLKNPRYADCDISFDKVEIELKTAIQGQVVEFSPEKGKISKVNATYRDGKYTIITSFPMLGSRLFGVIPENLTGHFLRPEENVSQNRQRVVLSSGPISVRVNENNVLPLDRARFRLPPGKWSGEKYVLFIDNLVRDKAGLARRSAGEYQPWCKIPSPGFKKITVEMEYRFDAECIPAGDIFLGIETPEYYEKITINGYPIKLENQAGWWCDRSLKLFPLKKEFIRFGTNIVTLRCGYTESFCGLESLFLLGDFGVKTDGLRQIITKPAVTLETGDWTTQYLPFYSGSVSYLFPYKLKEKAAGQITLRLNGLCGICVCVKINGKDIGTIAWPPWVIDIQDHLQQGDNLIEIEVFSSRRNSHGPLYMAEKWPSWTSPEQFDEFNGAYNLVPCGLMGEPELLF